MSPAQLERTLKTITSAGRRVEWSEAREVWRFESDGREYDLLFFRRHASIVGRLRHGNPAIRTFFSLQKLQELGVPVQRVIGLFPGFRLDGRIGDAVIVDVIAGAVPLDQYLSDLELSGQPIPNRKQLLAALLALVHALGKSRYGHRRLGLDSFLINGDKLWFRETAHIRRGGLRVNDLLHLEHSARHFATAGDRFRAWDAMEIAEPIPKKNRVSPKLWRRAEREVLRDSAYVQEYRSGEWRGFFTRGRCVRPRGWAKSSQLHVTRPEWDTAWTNLLARMNADSLEVLKRDPSGDVLAGTIELQGQPIDIVLKRPRRKTWWRAFVDLFRRSRGRRTWIKTWKMLLRDIPTEWPLLVMERRTFGYVVESITIYERVPGVTLAKEHLDTMSATDRATLFRRAGRTLRRIERLGFTHFDAKSSNWIVYRDRISGPTPVLLDLDGVRQYRWEQAGIERLLRAMKQHPQYTPDDSLNLCLGYAPDAHLVRRETPQPVAPEQQVP